eukprot:TRINITY_DN842_c0_g1_i1.p3 TRINITY_DN842_c0_g1~~TRINITY_DN842_c0_g1_i1.p3  ORF type:complete len:272 (-),score=45.68 TRINITY_DN842_c0_g1_i1:172-987(-)
MVSSPELIGEFALNNGNDAASCVGNPGAFDAPFEVESTNTIVLPGGSTTLVYTYTSLLPTDLQQITISDTLPSGFEFLNDLSVFGSASVDSSNVDGAEFSVTLDLPRSAGAVSVEITVVASSATPGTYPNEAFVMGVPDFVEESEQLTASANIFVTGVDVSNWDIASPPSFRGPSGELFTFDSPVVFVIDTNGDEINLNASDLSVAGGRLAGFRVLANRSNKRAVGTIFEATVAVQCAGLVSLSFQELSLSVQYIDRACFAPITARGECAR